MTAYGTEFFSMRDVNRLRILQDVIDRNLRPGLAAEMLGITPRHCSRLLKRYRQSGPLGMNNQSRGRTGNRLLSASLTDQALNIIRERYADFGPTLTWEKLAENHGLLLSNWYRTNATITGHRLSLPEMAPRADAGNPQRRNPSDLWTKTICSMR
ncbi:helix-turn-helix domain-containing protein [Klebsiella pneumoniae subsp. pneumoniae]|nr:helix-turn-helix domain-containing protein [Klebsiella pneumoniae subsp. pneumoniae]